jgi:hypothetical protein
MPVHRGGAEVIGTPLESRLMVLSGSEYIDSPPPGWFVLDVMAART